MNFFKFLILFFIIVFSINWFSGGIKSITDKLAMKTEKSQLSEENQNNYSNKDKSLDKNNYKTSDNHKQHHNYSLTPVDEMTLNFLKNKGYYRTNKKLVFYINNVNKQVKGQDEFTKAFNSYKYSPEWTKKYYFIEYKIKNPIVIDCPRKNYKKYKEGVELVNFTKRCQCFCVFDLKTKSGYSYPYLNKDQLYDVLYSLYNN